MQKKVLWIEDGKFWQLRLLLSTTLLPDGDKANHTFVTLRVAWCIMNAPCDGWEFLVESYWREHCLRIYTYVESQDSTSEK